MKKVWLTYEDGTYNIWKTKADAQKGLKDEDYTKGLFEGVCAIKDYIGFNPRKKGITEVTFK